MMDVNIFFSVSFLYFVLVFCFLPPLFSLPPLCLIPIFGKPARLSVLVLTSSLWVATQQPFVYSTGLSPLRKNVLFLSLFSDKVLILRTWIGLCLLCLFQAHVLLPSFILICDCHSKPLNISFSDDNQLLLEL